jgi:ferric-dicitrate binding protein FerR (iron transport regulator)
MGLVAGHLWINFKKMVTNGTMEVEMGQAVAGIKGTTLVLEQANGVSTLKVIEGTVAFTSKATGQTIDVNAGQTVSANFTGLTPVTNFDVTQESATWKTLAVAQKSQSSSVSSMMIIIIAAAVVVIVAVVVFILVKRKNKKEPAKE